MKLDTKTLKKKLALMDAEIDIKASEYEDIENELQALHAKRERFARRHCPHTKTTSSCGPMGRWDETTCDLCGVEL